MANSPAESETADASSGWFRTLISIPVLIGLLYFGRDFLIPISITLLLFILTTALVDRIDTAKFGQWTPPRWLARIMGIAIVLAGFAVIAMILSDEGEKISDALPKYSDRIDDLAERLQGLLGAKLVETIQKAIAEMDFGSWLSSIASGVSGLLATFSLVMLYLIFLISERQAFAEKLPQMAASEAGAARIEKMVHSISTGVKQYMWINAVTSAMSGFVAYVIFTLVGLDFAALLALTVFFVGFIPNIGAFIGIALPTLVALLQFDTWTPILIVVLGYGAADQFIANVIQPSLQGKSLNLSTFMVMVSLSFWSMIWGGVGAFLAVPMTVILMIVASEIPSLRPMVILFSGDGKLMDTENHNSN
ncbi:MAG: AI-2E family transporter [Rhizobiaceae bacterium]